MTVGLCRLCFYMAVLLLVACCCPTVVVTGAVCFSRTSPSNFLVDYFSLLAAKGPFLWQLPEIPRRNAKRRIHAANGLAAFPW